MPEVVSPLPATRELFERYGAMVYRRCAAILGGDDFARDAVQEVFLRVIERRHQFRGESSPSTWLYAVATLHCLQQLRDRTSRHAKLVQLADEPQLTPSRGPEAQLALVRLLDGEPDEVRLMVYLHYVDGMTMDEVANAVGYSRKTVSRRVNGFIATARAQLAVEGGLP
jgi:RNA polymerase sigma-70 factor (ECF subfamily)